MDRVMQDENRRRQHSRLFQKSIASSFLSSASVSAQPRSSSTSHSAKIETMCADITPGLFDASGNSVFDKQQFHVYLADLLPNMNIPEDVPISHNSVCRDSRISKRRDMKPESILRSRPSPGHSLRSSSVSFGKVSVATFHAKDGAADFIPST
eukprot:31910_1